MTLIIGMKYSEGIIIVGDKKVTDGLTTFYESKISMPAGRDDIIVAGSGFTGLAKEFSRTITDIITMRIGETDSRNRKDLNGTGFSIEDIISGKVQRKQVTYGYSYNNMIEDCSVLTKQLSDKARNLNPVPLFTIVATNSVPQFLCQIDSNGLNLEAPAVAIGSGSLHILTYLRKNHKPHMSFDEALLLGTFLVKYVEELELDQNVGVEKEGFPQVFVLSNELKGEYIMPKDKRILLMKEVNARIKKIKTATVFIK